MAERIPDGATLQLGIGKLANAIGDCLTNKKDLGIHTELLTSSMINLYEQGVITGRKKTLHPEKMVTAFSIGKTRQDKGLSIPQQQPRHGILPRGLRQ